jgi:hypothetical protein
MVAERATRAFWPLWSLVFVALAAAAFGAMPLLGPVGVWIVGAAGLVAIAWATLRGIRLFHMPTAAGNAGPARPDHAGPPDHRASRHRRRRP